MRVLDNYSTSEKTIFLVLFLSDNCTQLAVNDRNFGLCQLGSSSIPLKLDVTKFDIKFGKHQQGRKT
jgi:hypothetical protein